MDGNASGEIETAKERKTGPSGQKMTERPGEFRTSTT
jgi:hypothetical protein